MIEYRIGERVRILPRSLTSFGGWEGIVEGYERCDDEDVVIVSIPGKGCDQWLLPREIEPVKG